MSFACQGHSNRKVPHLIMLYLYYIYFIFLYVFYVPFYFEVPTLQLWRVLYFYRQLKISSIHIYMYSNIKFSNVITVKMLLKKWKFYTKRSEIVLFFLNFKLLFQCPPNLFNVLWTVTGERKKLHCVPCNTCYVCDYFCSDSFGLLYDLNNICWKKSWFALVFIIIIYLYKFV